MKQVFNLSGKIVVINDIPVPVCGNNEVLVKNFYSAISVGTESSNIKSAKGFKINKENIQKAIDIFKEKGIINVINTVKDEKSKLQTLGYSSCGRIIECGKNITNLSVGDIVSCAGGGYANHAEYIVVPRNLCCRIPDNVSLKHAAFTTIGSIALQGIRRLKPQIGEIVAVVGLGLLGLIAIQILSSAGCRVLGIDISQKKIDFAKKLGIEKGFIADDELEYKINSYCEDIGVDKTIIYAASSSSKPVHQAVGYTRKKGKIIVVGHVGMDIPRTPFYEKELDFGISCSYGPGRYDRKYEEEGIDYPISYVRWTENRNMKEFLRLISTKQVSLDELIEGEFEIDDANNAYDLIKNKDTKPGLLFKYRDIKEDINRKIQFNKAKIIQKSKLNVGIIGAGNFAQANHLPNLMKSKYFNLLSIATKNGNNAKRIGEKYHVKYYTTDYNDILDDNDVDLVIISTRHDLHSKIVLDSIKSKKNVLVEKPLCLNNDELKIIENNLEKYDINLCVDFNRRFAPAVLKVKEIIEENNLLEKGMIINFRINAASMRNHPYMNDAKQGGGVIIGEGCHFIDLMNYFMDSNYSKFQVISPSLNDISLIDTNNIIANIKYENGSLGSIIYTTIGNINYPKEQFEFYGKNMIFNINNYEKLIITSDKNINIKYGKIDKGHFSLLEEYGKFLLGKSNGKNLPLNNKAIESMKLTFEIIRNLKNEIGKR